MPTLHSDLQAGVRTLTLNRPERANAFDFELIQSLRHALDEAERDPQTRVLVLTGEGSAFGSGQDINEMKLAAGKISYREHLYQTYNPLVLKIRTIEKPVIAAVNGMCAGASLGVALACDLRIAADEAQFVVGFSGIGLVPDSGVSLFLPALIGLGRATEFYFSNEPINAATALQWGLVNEVVPPGELMERTLARCRRLAEGPPMVLSMIKGALSRWPMGLETLLEMEAHLQAVCFPSEDFNEGRKAFFEKRPPRFQGG
jgi:2-(1,2-epoxy-1,2-dihydrophenyl)acetyl-CoA isomerase